MNKTIKGTIKTITEVVEGTSEKGAWGKRTIVVSEGTEQYANEIVLSLFKNGDHVQYVKEKFSYKVGDSVAIEYSIRANEYKGKWYGDNSIFKIDKAEGVTATEEDSSLPF